MRISNEYTSKTGKQYTDYKFEAGDIVQIFSDVPNEFKAGMYPKTTIGIVGEEGQICNVVLSPAQITVFAKEVQSRESLKGLWVHCHSYDTAMRKGCVGVKITENDIPLAMSRPMAKAAIAGYDHFRKAGQEELTKLFEFCTQNQDVFMDKYGGRDVNSAFILWALSDNVTKEIGAKLDMTQAVKLYTDIISTMDED